MLRLCSYRDNSVLQIFYLMTTTTMLMLLLTNITEAWS